MYYNFRKTQPDNQSITSNFAPGIAFDPFRQILPSYGRNVSSVFEYRADAGKEKYRESKTMEITTAGQGCVVVVSLVGKLDTLTAETVSVYFDARVKEGQTCLIADLSRLDYMNSAGLRVILAIFKEARRRGGDFRLAATQENVTQMLQTVGFSRIIKMYPKVEAAVASYATN